MTTKRNTSGNKGGGSSTQSNSKRRGSSSRRNQNSSKGSSSYDNDYRENDSYSSRGSKGNSSYSDNRSTSKSGGNYSNDNTSRRTSSKGGSTGGDNYSRSSSSKGDGSYSNDDYDSRSSSKGSATQSDSYNRSSTSKGSSYANDDYSNDSSSKGGNDYNSEDTYNSGSSKGEDSYNDGYNDNNTYDDSNYDNNYDSSNEGQRYEDEPINDPPYDNNNDDIVAKQPNTNYRRNPSKDTDGNEADMTFTEEEAYEEENSTDNQNTSENTIERVWLWAGGAVPRTAINNSRATWWTSRVSLGMTDYVIALNDHDFSNGLGIKSNYVNRGERSNRWNPICEILRITDSHGIAPHLMIFLKPIPEMIRDAARVLQEIVEDSSVVPRSIQLDLEGWWTRRSASQRQAGERAIQQYFRDEWRAPRPSLGIGITCIGGVPAAIQGALAQVDFAIPQMYASERNYGRPIRENSVRRHFSRAAEALGNEGKVIAGQTAYSRYVNPEIMKQMLSVLLRLNHSNAGGVSEVAYWSDTHLRNSRANREFFQRLTSLVRQNGLNLNNIDNL